MRSMKAPKRKAVADIAVTGKWRPLRPGHGAQAPADGMMLYNRRPMRSCAAALAALMILFILWDAFQTIVLARRVSRRFRLTRLFYRSFWAPWRAAAARDPAG